MVMSGSGEHRFDDIVLTSCKSLDTLAASALSLVLRHGNTLDVAEVGQSEYAGFLGNEILDIDLTRNVHNLGAAVVAVFVGDLLTRASSLCSSPRSSRNSAIFALSSASSSSILILSRPVN